MSASGHRAAVTTRQRPLDVGAARSRKLVATCIAEVRIARLSSGLSQDDAASAAGISRGRFGRIERGEDGQVSIDELARIATVLGLELSVRFYPAGDPLRDAGHRAVLERFRAQCHPRLRVRTEPPFPSPGDLRAWDAVVSGFNPPIRCGVEAETRPTDEQALTRKLALKRRDGLVDRLILVVPDTRHNREFYRIATGLKASFPVPGGRALELLNAGTDPGGDAIVLL